MVCWQPVGLCSAVVVPRYLFILLVAYIRVLFLALVTADR